MATSSLYNIDASAMPNNSSSSFDDDSCSHIGFFIKNYPFVTFSELDPDTGVANEFLFLHCAAHGILTSSDKLVFCKLTGAKEGSIFMYNIATFRHDLIPLLPSSKKLNWQIVPAFGLSTVYNADLSQDYRFVLVFPTEVWHSEAYLEVFDSKNRAWVRWIIDIGKRNIQWEYSAVCGKRIFWVSDCGEYMKGCKPYILGLSLEYERTEIMHLPEEVAVTGSAEQYEIWITKLNEEALCMVKYDKSNAVLALWEIKLEPIPQWKLLQRISLAETELENTTQIYGFTLIRNKLLFFVIGSRIYSYNLEEQVLKMIREINSHHPVTLVAF